MERDLLEWDVWVLIWKTEVTWENNLQCFFIFTSNALGAISCEPAASKVGCGHPSKLFDPLGCREKEFYLFYIVYLADIGFNA